MLSDVSIINQKQDTAFREGGSVVPVIRTTFKVGDDGPFNVALPLDGFTAAKNIEAIEKLADSIRATREHLGSKA